MDVLSVLIGLALGLALGLIAGFFVFRKKDAGSLEIDLATAKANEASLREQITSMQSQQEETRRREQEQNKVLQELAPVKDRLDHMQKVVSELERERTEQFTTIKEQLRTSHTAQQELQNTTRVLAGAMSNNQVRGQWGELTLRRLLEQTGMVKHVDFHEQFSAENSDGKTIKPDVVIHMPDGKYVAVDSKVPFSNYQRAFEINELADEAEISRRDGFLKQSAKDVKARIDEISKKDYYSGLPESPEFTIMFMPSESLLSATLEIDPGLLEEAFEKRVAVVSPVSFYSAIKTISYAWRQQAAEETIQEVLDLGSKLYKTIRVVAEHAEKLGKELNSSVTAYNAFASSLERNMLTATRQVNEHSRDSLSGGREIPVLEEIEEATSNFTKPELTSEED
ncbi:MAG: DNA recombination protein RmuC [Microbacteriaceae bacterium]|nr:DNA recombination protein RmuC [Microbacteriaceae bacterium]